MLGILLLLLAGVLVLRMDISTQHSSAQQTARVAQAVALLENDGCLTCHTPTVSAPLALAHVTRDLFAAPTMVQLVAVQTADVSPSLQSTVDAQLLDLGQRLLALPDFQMREAEAVVTEYVNTTNATRELTISADSLAAQQLFTRLDRLVLTVQLHENQANPVQWTTPTTSSTTREIVGLATYSTSFSAPVAALHQDAVVYDVVLAGWALPASLQYEIPMEIMFATLRSGPPADAALTLDSANQRRLAIV